MYVCLLKQADVMRYEVRRNWSLEDNCITYLSYGLPFTCLVKLQNAVFKRRLVSMSMLLRDFACAVL